MTRSEGLGPEVKRRILMVNRLSKASKERHTSRFLLQNILQGSYALSAGHSDAYYKRAQEVTCTGPIQDTITFFVDLNKHFSLQVQRVVEDDLTSKLSVYDALITPAAPTPAYSATAKVLR